jgi:long-chain fatty acid transport protein
MVMSQKTLFNKTALAVAVALVSTSAWSAGFQLNEFSSSGLGRAYSGEGAIADDAGNASRNPALIMMFDRPTFSAGAVYIDPDVNISGKSPYRCEPESGQYCPNRMGSQPALRCAY